MKKIFCLFILLVAGCSTSPHPSSHKPRGEYIYRHAADKSALVEPMQQACKEFYIWEKEAESKHPKITKEFFRCKGNGLNPVRLVQRGNEVLRFYDCGGVQKHGLPLRDQKEFVYPILIDLLNYIQAKTEKRVVITCGHCCPEHNSYLNPSPSNSTSKHMIGAEVDFYVQGLEEQPEAIVALIMAYYGEGSKYFGNKEFEVFKRYEKEDCDLATPPWFNKEIFIKLYRKDEGRDGDNQHPYPYLSIQVRYDCDKKERVVYSWDKAFRNFHRK